MPHFRKAAILLAPVVFFLLSACFGGVKKTGKVIDYKPGLVVTKKGSYQVGELSPDWYRIKLGLAAINFRNDSFGSTISTDAYCDQAYDDAPLPSLAGHLYAGLQDIKIQSQTPLTLDRRGALRSSVKASLDGVPVQIESVVIKKDWCLFDFFLVGPPERVAGAIPAFEHFYRGFVYDGGEES
jgi:hypothetical protein